MAERIYARVNAEVLIWARESVGGNRDRVADKLGLKREKLAAWEDGSERPTIPQLRKLAAQYKRPLATFFLPEPPKQEEEIQDFRLVPGEAASKSPELLVEVRSARERRQVALELSRLLREEVPEFSHRAALSENAEAVGARLRGLLDVSVDEQVCWKHEHEALNAWTHTLENVGVLVFQSGKLPSDISGVSVSEKRFPLVVLNKKDIPRRRVFTLLHEFAHLLLSAAEQDLTARGESIRKVVYRSIVCDLRRLEYDENDLRHERRVEVFCNRVAGAILVPRVAILEESTVRSKGPSDAWHDGEIGYLANRFCVSREVLLRRLLIVRRISQAFYDAKRKQYQKEWITEKPGFALVHQRKVSDNGLRYTELVLDAYSEDEITSTEVARYLDVRLQHLDRIRDEVSRKLRSLEAVP